MLFPWGLYKKSLKFCHPRAANSISKWYHANFKLSSASNFIQKPFYLTRGFVTSHGCHWLYLVSVDSFLSVSDTRTWDLMSSCIFAGKIKGNFYSLIINNSHVKISENLSLHFWHITFREPQIYLGSKFWPGLWMYYVLALSVLNFSPLNAIFLSILTIFSVRLIMWEVL